MGRVVWPKSYQPYWRCRPCKWKQGVRLQGLIHTHHIPCSRPFLILTFVASRGDRTEVESKIEAMTVADLGGGGGGGGWGGQNPPPPPPPSALEFKNIYINSYCRLPLTIFFFAKKCDMLMHAKSTPPSQKV